jgi:hypothetical protein
VPPFRKQLRLPLFKGEALVNTQTITNWIQTLTGLAVLGGLVLIVWELQQVRDVSMAQMTSDGFDIAAQLLIAEIGENPAEVFEKSCSAPATLTESDLMVLDAYNRALLIQVRRPYTIERRSGLYVGTWKEIAPLSLGGIFDNLAGRIWWQENRFSLPEEIRLFGDELVENPGHRDCFVNDWKNLINAEASKSPSAGS